MVDDLWILEIIFEWEIPWTGSMTLLTGERNGTRWTKGYGDREGSAALALIEGRHVRTDTEREVANPMGCSPWQGSQRDGGGNSGGGVGT
jgi:hypothetical protein